MSIKHRIVLADFEAPIRSIVNECMPVDHLDFAEFDGNTGVVLRRARV